jgi:hypothetical protein
VMKPIQISADYIRPIVYPTPTAQQFDPVVGSWQYTGDGDYQCNARFTSDSKASASCSKWGIPLVQKSLTWNPSSSPHNWMRNYTIIDVSDKREYSVMYSEHTGRLTSEIMPGNGYLVKVG